MARPVLFGVDIAGELNRAMGPLMLAATLTRTTPGTRPAGQLTAGLTNGDTTTAYPCRGFTEEWREGRLGSTADGGRAQTLVRAGDRKISIFGASLPDAIDPRDGDTITIEGATYTIVGDVTRDPVAAVFVCRGRL